MLTLRARRDDHDGAGGCAAELRGKPTQPTAPTPIPATRANNDHHRHLLASDPRELAGAVADFRTAIGAAFQAVLARDPLEQPLTPTVRLRAARTYAVSTAVAISHMRKY